jgi:hypothetical protein
MTLLILPAGVLLLEIAEKTSYNVAQQGELPALGG